jgi:hypothetical protein
MKIATFIVKTRVCPGDNESVLGFIQIALSAGPAPDIIALASLRSRFYP